MATFTGSIDITPDWSGALQHPAFGLKDVPEWDIGFLGAEVVNGSLNDTQPVLENPTTQPGSISYEYDFLHWYNRIHIQYSLLNLGNVVGDQEVEFWVLNTYFVPVTLENLTGSGIEGLTLVQPAVPPYDFAPFEEKTYALLVSTVGPPELQATYEFDFGAQGLLTLQVIGTRVIGWHWEPNWAEPVKERLQWLTDVQESFDGSGQFMQLREYPRQEWEFLVDLSKRRARTAETTLYGWNGRVWAVPVWPDIEILTFPLSEGTEIIEIPTTTKQYRNGGMVMLISENNDSYETAEIEFVNSNSLELVRPLANAWPTGTRVYPVSFCRMAGQVFSRFTEEDSYGTVTFRSTFGIPYSSLSEATYRSYPVLTVPPQWNTDPTVGFQDKITVFDNPVGESYYDRESNIPRVFYSWNWTELTRAEIDVLRKFVYSRRGRARAVWIPTNAADLVMKATTGSSSLAIDVEHSNLVKFLTEDSTARRDIRIELKNGSIFYRRITEFNSVDATTENISIDSSLGVLVNPQDVHRISWLTLVHLDNDEIEFSWETPYIASSDIAMRAYNNDI